MRIENILKNRNIVKIDNDEFLVQNILDKIQKLFTSIPNDGWRDSKIENIIKNDIQPLLEKEISLIPVNKQELIRNTVLKVLKEQNLL